MTSTSTPIHLQDHRCFICGGTKHAPASGHDFWSNADARRTFQAEDYKRLRYADTDETTVEGQYVATTRGR